MEGWESNGWGACGHVDLPQIDACRVGNGPAPITGLNKVESPTSRNHSALAPAAISIPSSSMLEGKKSPGLVAASLPAPTWLNFPGGSNFREVCSSFPEAEWLTR